MVVLTFEDIKKFNVSPENCYQWIQQSFKQKSDCCLPAKISMKPKDQIFFNVMPCILNSPYIAGAKIISRFPERSPALDSQIMLYDAQTGEMKALMDGNYITALRTGAVAALAIQTLAVKNYMTLGFIGLGNMARATMKILFTIIKDRNIIVKLYKYKDQANLIIEEFKDFKNISFKIIDTYEQVVRDSDVIVSCITYADHNLANDDCFKPGCLVVPVHTCGFQNCDLFFDKVIVDDIAHVKNFKYYSKFKYIEELANLLSNKSEGRKNDEERILSYNIGLSIHDIYFANQIFTQLESTNHKVIDLMPPKEKFWF